MAFYVQSTNKNILEKESVESKVKLAKISSLFPISSHDDLRRIEHNLKEREFAEKVAEHIKDMKVHKGDFDKVLRCLFSDGLIYDYNSDGRKGKRSLSGLNLVSTHLLSLFPELTRPEFFKLVRRYVLMSHNRYKHKMYHARKYDVFNY